MVWKFSLAMCLMAFVLPQWTAAQDTGSSTNAPAATRFYQSQVYSGIGNSGQGSGQTAVPYYVEPSRFYYNRPGMQGTNSSGSLGSNAPQGPTYNIQVRPGFYYHGFYPAYRYPYGYPYRYFGPQVYYPRVYQIAPGVTEHVGPFIPIIP
ncbi:MAG: hypothetical protein NXI32_01610 [bacterium]|nr:hypothetical protein [bacterium]